MITLSLHLDPANRLGKQYQGRVFRLQIMITNILLDYSTSLLTYKNLLDDISDLPYPYPLSHLDSYSAFLDTSLATECDL